MSVTAILVAGCASATTPPLASMSVRGGLCPSGPCEELLVVDVDGGWEYVTTERPARTGRLPAAELARLRRAVADSAITAGPLPAFTGTCPTASDGFEVTYVLHTARGSRSASTCEVVVPDDDAAAAILDGLRDQAT